MSYTINDTMPRMQLYLSSIHYSKLFDRRKNVLSLLSFPLAHISSLVTENHILPEFLPDFSSLTPSKEIYNQVSSIYHLLYANSVLVTSDDRQFIKANYSPNYYSNSSPWTLDTFFSSAVSSYSLKNSTLTAQHISAIAAFMNTDCDLCLILEDDSVYNSNSINALQLPEANLQLLKSFFTHLSSSFSHPFYLDLSQSLGIYSTSTCLSMFSNLIWEAVPGFTQCASAYVINRPLASLILSASFPIVLPIDWYFSFLLCYYSVKSYSVNFPFFLQGSVTHDFTSNQYIRSNL